TFCSWALGSRIGWAMPKKQQKGKSLSSFYFRFLQPGDAIIGFLESAVGNAPSNQRDADPSAIPRSEHIPKGGAIRPNRKPIFDRCSARLFSGKDEGKRSATPLWI